MNKTIVALALSLKKTAIGLEASCAMCKVIVVFV